MPSAVRKSAARSSPEHVSFLSPTPVHRNGSTPSTSVLNEMAVWRPEMRSSFAFAGSGGQAGGVGGARGVGGGIGGGIGGAIVVAAMDPLVKTSKERIEPVKGDLLRAASAPRQKLVLMLAWLPLGVSEAIVAPSKKRRRVVPSNCAPVVCHAPSQMSEMVMPEEVYRNVASLPYQ